MADTTKQYTADNESRTSGRIYLEPFDPSRHKPVDLGDGEYMTERTRTVIDQSGKWMVVPSLWFNEMGNPVDLQAASDDQLSKFSDLYEHATGNMFPRFGSLDAANGFAASRSKAGGATHSRIFVRDSGGRR